MRADLEQFVQKELKTEEVYEFIANSIDQIFQGEEVYDSSTTTKKEFREFVDSLTTKQFEKIQQFYATAPRLSHTFTVVNPNTGKDWHDVTRRETIEGAEAAIDGSIDHFTKKVEASAGPKVVKTF